MNALLLLLAPLAHGHAGADFTAVDLEREDAIETGFGLLLEESDGWHWVCHEAITTSDAIITPRYSTSPTGTWLAVVPDVTQAREEAQPVYRSEAGCSWDPVTGLDDQAVSDVLFIDEDTAIATTAEQREGRSGGIFRSTDGGLTFSDVHPLDEGRLVLRVLASGQTVYAASFVPESPSQAELHVSTDAGATWTDLPLDLSDLAGSQTTLAVRPVIARGDEVWLAVNVLTGHVLLHSDDRGASTTTVLVADGTLLDGAIATDGSVWMLEGPRGAWHSTDGVDFEPVEAPPAIGLSAFSADATLATSAAFTGGLTYQLTADGTATIGVQGSDLVGPLACDPGTEQHDICEPLWEQVLLAQPKGPTEETDTTDDTDLDGSEGCGCATSSAPAWVALLPLLLVWRRRR